MRRRVGRLVQVDETMTHVVLDRSLVRRAARLQWCVVAGANVHTMIVLQEGVGVRHR